ncbi:MAG: hypothetical protein ACLFVJ_11760 [Persicimonas sp.]
MAPTVYAAVCVLLLSLIGCQSSPGSSEDTFEQMVGSAPGAAAESPSDADETDGLRRGALWYQLEVGSESVDVHVRLLEPPERTSFFLPGRWAGRSDFADNISIRGAIDDGGSVPFTIDRSNGRIDVESEAARWIQLNYSVKLREDVGHRWRFHPRFNAGVLFAYGPAFLVLPSDQISRKMRDIPIEVRTPSSWQVLSTWRHVDSSDSAAVQGASVHGFSAKSAAVLRDTFIAAGSELEVHQPLAPSGQSAMTIGFSPLVRLDHDKFSGRIAELIEAYRRRFGDLGPVTAFVQTVAADDNQRARGVGRRGGFVVEFPADQQLDDQAMLLLAHEAFHLWNGHHLTPKPSAERRTRWFKEGVTHYIALQMLYELGLFDREDVLGELSEAAKLYRRNPAARGQTSTSNDRARLPYDKGVLLAIALDATLLSETDGEVSLQDWVEHLLADLGEGDKRYDAGDLRDALVTVAGSANAESVELWDMYVAGSALLEPAQIFDTAGLHWLSGSDRPAPRLLPVRRDDSPFGSMFPR